MTENTSFTKYLSRSTVRYFKKKSRRFRMRSDLGVSVVKNGIVVVNAKTGAYGVFDADKRFVKSSLCLWGGNGQFVPKIKDVAKEVQDFTDTDAVFCGRVMEHFGEGMLSGTPRLWVATLSQYKQCKYVFVSKTGEMPEFNRVLLRGLGIADEDIIVTNRNMRFRNVFVPDQAYNLLRWSSAEFGTVFGAISDYYDKHVRVDCAEKIYVSRGKLAVRGLFGEKQIEKIFAKNGFRIVYPETLSLERQIALMSRCKVLAGAAGTALHLSLFMKVGGTVVWIKRNSKSTEDNLGLQNMLCKTRNQNLVPMLGSIEKKETGHFTNCPQIIGITPEIKKFFDDYGFKYTAHDIVFDKKEYDNYLNALGEYEKTVGNERMRRIKKKIIHILACFVPGRINRERFRNALKPVFGI